MTLSEIEKVLEKRAVIAVNHATELIMKDMSEVIADYYGDYPNPKRYKRTGLLKGKPKVFKAPAFSGNSLRLWIPRRQFRLGRHLAFKH